MQTAMVFVGSQLSTTFSVIFVFESVTVPPLLKTPPPWAALLLVTWLWPSVSSPPNRGGGPWGQGYAVGDASAVPVSAVVERCGRGTREQRSIGFPIHDPRTMGSP